MLDQTTAWLIATTRHHAAARAARAPFEAVGVLEYDASTDELLPAELDPSATAAYAARPAPPAGGAGPADRCPLHGDSPRYCGCDPTC